MIHIDAQHFSERGSDRGLADLGAGITHRE
jgi:hypothetical protein